MFELHQPTVEKLPDYLALLDEFYPLKATKGAAKTCGYADYSGFYRAYTKILRQVAERY